MEAERGSKSGGEVGRLLGQVGSGGEAMVVLKVVVGQRE